MTESKGDGCADARGGACVPDTTLLPDAIARAISPNWRLHKLGACRRGADGERAEALSVQPVVEAPPPPNAASANGETNAMLGDGYLDRSDTSKDALWISKPSAPTRTSPS